MARLADELGNTLSAGNDLPTALSTVFLGTHGYHGDTLTYDDIQNANLMRVIDRKKGLPVALGILFIQAVRANGVAAAGLNFPGHFLIRLEDGCERIILDPFNHGIQRSAADMRELLKALSGLEAELMPEYYEAVDNRDILIRLQNNIKARHERAGRPENVLRVIERMLLFAPRSAFLWREAGVFHARMGSLGSAIDSFEKIVSCADNDAERTEAVSTIQKLKSRLN
jgi:regulator of sirC expression with transglutaminase-like and TPR domain